MLTILIGMTTVMTAETMQFCLKSEWTLKLNNKNRTTYLNGYDYIIKVSERCSKDSENATRAKVSAIGNFAEINIVWFVYLRVCE